MFSYIARQAILDKNKELYSYELLFRDGENNCFPDIPADEATSKILTDSHLDLGLDDITAGKPAFINFSQDTLLHRFPTSLDPKKVVIEVVETVNPTAKLVIACKNIKESGYSVALDDHDFDPKWDVLLPYIDIIKVDIVECDEQTLIDNIGKYKGTKIKLVAEKIETIEDFEKYRDMGFDYFQGYFFARPQIIKQKRLPTSKLSLIQLIGASSASEFDLEKVSGIIQRDVSLSYKLLRFINNPAINKSCEISDLRHALNYMGQVEVKKFIALLALANLGDNKPVELIHLSLVRAKFCELIGQAKSLENNPPTGFLIGLFSLLDALLDQPMEGIVEKLPIGENIKAALCGDENELKPFLALIRAFEAGYWNGVAKISKQLSLDLKMTQAFYNESLKWGIAMKQSV
ncbi:EAL domain-containing protein [uncultured Paraglaciecola sp.]|uniref:EAL and HDOD domain-containing protein n=1 Tax=uncultured Paraglaciecola sp. TaxID=1765024 RepID=UPI0025F5E226|nr:EAL domain-containing protein [uncultured Paraglaciecola sp.]